MSLYSEWTEMLQSDRTPAQAKEFKREYFDKETAVYKRLLADHKQVCTGTLGDLADQFDMDPVVFTGFMDGVNTSLKKEYDLDSLKITTKIELDIDWEKLYFNMHDAKASWLYTLPEWDGVLTEEKRKQITREYRASKMFVKTENIGRNDPCPCGSGKKYKKCCGKQD